MSDHLDSPGSIVITVNDDSAAIGSPNGDPRTDITDVYAFLKPGDSRKSILVLNVNPLAPMLASAFNHQAIYEINVDTDGDARADRSFRIRFSKVVAGKQHATVRMAVGDLRGAGHVVIEGAPVSFGSTPVVTTRGRYRFFAGLRSDPFFFDLLGFFDDLTFTHGDFFADKNVFGIVLEVPNSALGTTPATTSLWGRTWLNTGASRTRDDRVGRSAINTVFNHGVDKNIFNSQDPKDDLTAMNSEGMTFVASFAGTLTALGGNPALATVLLPDMLNFDTTKPTSYATLNGRSLQDDVIDISLSLVSGGGITTDNVGPHTDYLSDFPYLGTPH